MLVWINAKINNYLYLFSFVPMFFSTTTLTEIHNLFNSRITNNSLIKMYLLYNVDVKSDYFYFNFSLKRESIVNFTLKQYNLSFYVISNNLVVRLQEEVFVFRCFSNNIQLLLRDAVCCRTLSYSVYMFLCYE